MILDFQNISNDSKYLLKLKNNLEVSYFHLSPKDLDVFENRAQNIKVQKVQNIKRAKNEYTMHDYKVDLIKYSFNYQNNEQVNYLDPKFKTVHSPSKIKLETESRFQGKEVFAHVGSISDEKFIFKRPKTNDVNLDMKIKIQLIAQHLAKKFSKFFKIIYKFKFE